MQTKLEKPKLKHNKKRNTAFLFETLVKELTKAVVYRDTDKQKMISALIKEHFKKNTVLDKELTLYKQIYETKQFPKNVAERLIDQVVSDHQKLNEKEIFSEQSKLIAKINKMLGFQIYNNFVPNYKTIASISQIFNKTIEPKRRVLLEQELCEHITGEEAAKKQEAEVHSNLVLQRFQDRFNKIYGENLNSHQKQLLSRYIRHHEDDIDLKVYLNEEIHRLKKEIDIIKNNKLIKESNELDNKLNEVWQTLKDMKVDEITDSFIKKIMLIQEFLSEASE